MCVLKNPKTKQMIQDEYLQDKSLAEIVLGKITYPDLTLLMAILWFCYFFNTKCIIVFRKCFGDIYY